MSRDEQEQIRRDRQRLCQAQYRRGDQPTFINARCKKSEGHVGKHKTWRQSQVTVAGHEHTRKYLEWEA